MLFIILINKKRLMDIIHTFYIYYFRYNDEEPYKFVNCSRCGCCTFFRYREEMEFGNPFLKFKANCMKCEYLMSFVRRDFVVSETFIK